MTTPQGPGPDLNKTLPRDHDPKADFATARGLKRELLQELRASWEEGEQPLPPEQLLPRWPEPVEGADVVSLLFEDYLQRQKRGEPVSADSYSQRFPQQADKLASMVRQNDLLRSVGGSDRAIARYEPGNA